MKALRPLAAWLLTVVYLVLKVTCRVRTHADPRPELRSAGRTYIYSVLHAHHVSTVLFGERGTGAMVSQSGDGALLVPCLRMAGIVPVRGSTDRGGRDRGGRAAFRALVRHMEGGRPAYLAVDGPRGPRNRIHPGVALLALKTGATVLNVCAVPRRRWVFARSWDRLQIPKPFSTIDVYFGETVHPQPGERAEHFRQRVETALNALEREHDPAEAEIAQPVEAERTMVTAA